MSTGAGESPTDLASLLVPTATTSSISSAAETKEGITGIDKRETATAIPLILVLNILFTPKLINKYFGKNRYHEITFVIAINSIAALRPKHDKHYFKDLNTYMQTIIIDTYLLKLFC